MYFILSKIEIKTGYETKTRVTAFVLLRIKIEKWAIEFKIAEPTSLGVIFLALSCTMAQAIPKTESNLLKVKKFKDVCCWA